MALTNVELLTLSRDDMNTVFFHDFPELGRSLYQRAITRRFKLINAYEKAIEYQEFR